jgi:hypothetical protein
MGAMGSGAGARRTDEVGNPSSKAWGLRRDQDCFAFFEWLAMTAFLVIGGVAMQSFHVAACGCFVWSDGVRRAPDSCEGGLHRLRAPCVHAFPRWWAPTMQARCRMLRGIALRPAATTPMPTMVGTYHAGPMPDAGVSPLRPCLLPFVLCPGHKEGFL